MSDESTAPVLVLGIGNTLLGDDGLGVHMVNLVSRWSRRWHGAVEFLEGGTQGISLLGSLIGRAALVILDAVSLGAPPGTVHLLRDEEVLDLSFRSTAAHEGNAGELLAAAILLGELPGSIYLVGVEPARLECGIGLSEFVQKAVPRAIVAARNAIAQAVACRSQPEVFDLRQPQEWSGAG